MKIALKRFALAMLLVGLAPMMESAIVSAGESVHAEHCGEAASETVYYCTGPNAAKYHRSAKCRGLRKCSCSIVKCTKSEAQAKGFKPCKICY
ncbi:MAG: hypothetical protein K2K75_12575 [Muribaculaceae bacterium]|nr:hypothetical protein [Muribaculaceae bacterium]